MRSFARIHSPIWPALGDSSITEIHQKLAATLSSSGYPISESDDRLTPLAEKLTLLEATGRYSRLLSSLFATNDKANLQSHILEATFAYQFELSGKPLDYEVQRRSDDEYLGL